MINKKRGGIVDELEREIEKQGEQSEPLEEAVQDSIRRQIDRANEKLKTPPKKSWIH